eukprot:GHVP01014625.1.p1 GENE.GHVP01014625.1~~GHVP01014625.1.p1  ORF type:complete len:199 (-),score=35.91 GHVP01014625.1:67-663(-)
MALEEYFNFSFKDCQEISIFFDEMFFAFQRPNLHRISSQGIRRSSSPHRSSSSGTPALKNITSYGESVSLLVGSALFLGLLFKIFSSYQSTKATPKEDQEPQISNGSKGKTKSLKKNLKMKNKSPKVVQKESSPLLKVQTPVSKCPTKPNTDKEGTISKDKTKSCKGILLLNMFLFWIACLCFCNFKHFVGNKCSINL